MKTTVLHIIGYAAGIITTVSFVPQVVKVYQTRHTKDLSLVMLALFCLGVSLWTAYGVMLRQAPIIFPNAVVLLLAGYILVMKLKYK